jgi:Ion channel
MWVRLKDRLRTAGRHATQNRCLFLVVGLLVALGIGPWLEDLGARVLVDILALGAFASAIHAVGSGRWYTLALLLLGTATAVFGLLVEVTGSIYWLLPGLCLYIVFGIFTLIALFGYVVRPGTITVDKIYGALSIYLLAGFTWGGVYSLIEVLNPGSFHWTHAVGHYPKTLLQSFVYLSFVTLASLGYGDITPVTPEARSVALLEVIFGVFYLVVVIARLVAGFEPGTRRDR